MLNGKKILLGVTGSIAAYKAAFLVRLLIKSKAEVRVIMTSSAGEFISSLTLSTLSKNPVVSEFVKGNEGEWNIFVRPGTLHIEILKPIATKDWTRETLDKHLEELHRKYLKALDTPD